MGCISRLFVGCDVSKDKTVQPGICSDCGLDTGSGQEDDPGNDPDGQEYFDHHTKETNEKVCIHAVCLDDGFIVGIVDGQRPTKEGWTEWGNTFTMWCCQWRVNLKGVWIDSRRDWDISTWFVNCFKIRTKDCERSKFSAKNSGVEH